MYRIVKELRRPDPTIINEFRAIGTSDIADAMGKYRVGCMDPRIKAVIPNVAFIGCALTVKTHEGSNLIIHKAVTMAKPGDVIVVDAGQNEMLAVWGGTLSQICKARGLAGAIIDGAVRDLRAMKESGFPVLARSVTPVGSMRALGSINIPISCGGVPVFPGDVVVCDEDGVVVVPQMRLEEILPKAKAVQAKGEDIRQRVAMGEFPIDFLGMADLLNNPEISVVERDDDNS